MPTYMAVISFGLQRFTEKGEGRRGAEVDGHFSFLGIKRSVAGTRADEEAVSV